MKLTLSSPEKTVQVTLSLEAFKRLRDPEIRSDEIDHIATQNGIEPSLLQTYVFDLPRPIVETFELEGSCEYSDQL